MAEIIDVDDLPTAIQSHESVDLMVDGANAKASRVAPCLASTDPVPTDDQIAEAKLVLVGAVKRWAETGAGALQTQAAGPFSMGLDTRQRTGYNLWPSEIEGLQEICRETGSGGTGRAFEIDTMPADAGVYGVDYWWQLADRPSLVLDQENAMPKMSHWRTPDLIEVSPDKVAVYQAQGWTTATKAASTEDVTAVTKVSVEEPRKVAPKPAQKTAKRPAKRAAKKAAKKS